MKPTRQHILDEPFIQMPGAQHGFRGNVRAVRNRNGAAPSRIPRALEGNCEFYVQEPERDVAVTGTYTQMINVPKRGASGLVAVNVEFYQLQTDQPAKLTISHGGVSKILLDTNDGAVATILDNRPFLLYQFAQVNRAGTWTLEFRNRLTQGGSSPILSRWWLVFVLPGNPASTPPITHGDGGGGSGGGADPTTDVSFAFVTAGFLDVLDTRDNVWRSIPLIDGGVGGGVDETPVFDFLVDGFMGVLDTRAATTRYIELSEEGSAGDTPVVPEFQFNTPGFLDVLDPRDSMWRQIELGE